MTGGLLVWQVGQDRPIVAVAVAAGWASICPAKFNACWRGDSGARRLMQGIALRDMELRQAFFRQLGCVDKPDGGKLH